jgi:hypothetical protein
MLPDSCYRTHVIVVKNGYIGYNKLYVFSEVLSYIAYYVMRYEAFVRTKKKNLINSYFVFISFS